MKTKRLLPTLLLAGALILAGCGSGGQTAGSQTKPASQSSNLKKKEATVPQQSVAAQQAATKPGAISSSMAPLSGISISKIKMFADGHGFALVTDSGGTPLLAVTTDGGQTWLNAMPENLKGSTAMVLPYFLNAQTGWIGILKPGTSVTVYRTSDGGKTWDESAPFATRYGDGNGQIRFADAQHGWVEVLTAGMGALQAQLFRSTDGGKTWSLVSHTGRSSADMPFGGDLTFTSATTGFLSGGPRAAGGPFVKAWLYVTKDGGADWAHVTLPLPQGIAKSTLELEPPRFFGQNGVLVVHVQGETSSVIFYTTQDGGSTWSMGSPITVLGPIDIVSARDWIVVPSDAGTLRVTSDGGQDWQTMAPSAQIKKALQSSYVSAVDFTSLKDGWLVLSSRGSSGSVLLRTQNGGQSWTKVG